MLFKSFPGSFNTTLDVLMIMFEIFLCGCKSRDEAKKFSSVSTHSVYQYLQNAGKSCEYAEESLAEYIRMRDGEDTLSRFYVYFKDWKASNMLAYYVDSSIAEDALMNHFKRLLPNNSRAALGKVESAAIYTLFKESLTLKELDYSQRSFLPYLKNHMERFFLHGEKSNEIYNILNRSGLNYREEKNDNIYSTGQFVSIQSKVEYDRSELDDLDFAEISKKIANVSEKGRCIAFYHGKQTSAQYSFYDVFSYLKFRDLTDYEKIIKSGVPDDVLKAAFRSEDLQVHNASIVVDDGVRSQYFMRVDGAEVKYTACNFSDATLRDQKLITRKAGLDVMYKYFTGELRCNALSDLYTYVYAAEKKNKNKDIPVVFDANLDKTKEDTNIRAWHYYFDGFKAAYNLYTLMKKHRINIFDLDCSVFAVRPLVGKFEKLSDCLRYSDMNKLLVLNQPVGMTMANDADPYEALVAEYMKKYGVSASDELAYVKHIPLNKLIDTFYNTDEQKMSVENEKTTKEPLFDTVNVDRLIYRAIYTMRKSLLKKVPNRDEVESDPQKFLGVVLPVLTDSFLGEYRMKPTLESYFNWVRDEEDESMRSSFSVLLKPHLARSHKVFGDLEPFEQVMYMARVSTFLYAVREELYTVIQEVRGKKYDIMLYSSWEKHRAFIEMLSNPTDLGLLEKWYPDLMKYYLTSEVSKSDALMLFRYLLRWFTEPWFCGDLAGDIKGLLNLLNDVRKNFDLVESRVQLLSLDYETEINAIKDCILTIVLTSGVEAYKSEGVSVDPVTGLQVTSTGDYKRVLDGNTVRYYYGSDAVIIYDRLTRIAWVEGRTANEDFGEQSI